MWMEHTVDAAAVAAAAAAVVVADGVDLQCSNRYCQQGNTCQQGTNVH